MIVVPVVTDELWTFGVGPLGARFGFNTNKRNDVFQKTLSLSFERDITIIATHADHIS